MKVTSAKSEEYLEAIYKLAQTERPVRVHQLAERLGVSPSAVTDMLRKMARDGLVGRSSDGISLTERGEKAAIGLVRRHRLWERFLTDILGISWDKVHDEACKLEHIASPEIQEGLERLLENPETCPHGHPIPNKDGAIATATTRPLCDLPCGAQALIVRVAEEDPKMLQYLATLGLIPKVSVTIEEVAPFRGPLLVRVGSARYAIGRDVASKIHVAEAADQPNQLSQ